jgi:hypothetical protein
MNLLSSEIKFIVHYSFSCLYMLSVLKHLTANKYVKNGNSSLKVALFKSGYCLNICMLLKMFCYYIQYNNVESKLKLMFVDVLLNSLFFL